LAGVWDRVASKKIGTPYLFLQPLIIIIIIISTFINSANGTKPLKPATSNFVHKLDFGLAYQKRRLGPKLSRVWDREASKKIGTPYLLLQPLKLATSNFVHKLDLDYLTKKNNV